MHYFVSLRANRQKHTDMQAMIFAAGLGTRLQPLTNDRPKAMVEVAGRPLLEHVILKLREQGFSHIVVNVHHFGEQIIDFLQANHNFGLDIRVSDERRLLLNTGGGIKAALPMFDLSKPILIHNVDIACDMDLAGLYHQAEEMMTERAALMVTKQRQTSRFLLFNREGLLRGWLNEKPEGNVGKCMGTEPIDELVRMPFTGIHVLMPGIYKALEQYPDEVFSIIDFYLSACIEHPIAHTTLPQDCRWVDCGKVEALERAREILED